MAKKLESNFINMLIALLLIPGVAAIALSATYNATKKTIEESEKAKATAAIKEVIPCFETMEQKTVTDASGNELTIYTCMANGAITGTAIRTYSLNGFGGKIEIMVGISPDEIITKTVVLAHSETPGLGDKIDPKKSNFSPQFWGKKVSDLQTDGVIKVKKDGGKIDAITAATISSRAFSDAIQRAYMAFLNNKKDGGTNE
jgi:electron transport complex protein RnfG